MSKRINNGRTTSGDEVMGEAGIPHSVVNVSATGSEPHVYRAREVVEPTLPTAHNRAPVPNVPEIQNAAYERKQAPNTPGKLGPSRFEEGLAADVRYPSSFVQGIANGYVTAPERPSHNASYSVMASKTADGRGTAGRTNPPPTWDQVRRNELGAFVQGHGDPQGLGDHFAEQAPLRVGTDLSRLDLSERGRQVFDKSIAVNDDRFRPNAASGYRASENRA